MTVVTFTTDFGSRDAYAGVMKGVVLSLAPDAVLVDVTHEIPRHDIVAGALALEQAAPYFPAGTVHVAVVDPGVGGARAGLVVESGGQAFVGPDNGLLSLAARHPRTAFRIDNPQFRREPVCPTFHGRDVFAVAGARLASGWAARTAGPALSGIVELPVPATGALTAACRGAVLHVDGFGNLVTTLTAGATEGTWRLDCAGRELTLRGGLSFCDVAEGESVLYLGSSGHIEIAVRNGSAVALTGARAGTPFVLRRSS
jgi:S-adenosyl-L-methionine hydrolase (adenosine-forming)